MPTYQSMFFAVAAKDSNAKLSSRVDLAFSVKFNLAIQVFHSNL